MQGIVAKSYQTVNAVVIKKAPKLISESCLLLNIDNTNS
jgi:hypothetical protein